MDAPVKSHLDAQTIANLEKSLFMQILKLFAIIAKVDPNVSIEERIFVLSYCEQHYPQKISMHLFRRFDQFLQTDPDLEEVTTTLNVQLGYQEKIFCFVKLYELIASDVIKEDELNLCRQLSEKLGIFSSDLAFIEKRFNIRENGREIAEQPTIMQIIVSSDPEQADIYIPIEKIDLSIFKVNNLYFMLHRDRGNVVLLDGRRVLREVYTRVPRNADISVGKYAIKYHNLKYHFENKIHPIQADMFLCKEGGEYKWRHDQKDTSLLQMRLNGSLIQMSRISDRDVCCTINESRIEAREWMYVNLDDDVIVEDNILNLKEIFFHLNREKEIPLAEDQPVYTITNDIRGDIFISDDMPAIWYARLSKTDHGYLLSRGDCPYQIRVSGEPLTKERIIESEDTIFVNNRFLFFDFVNPKVKQTLFSFEKLMAEAVDYAFDDGTLGLRDISFKITYGDLVCIMGPSGCGKSTLLSILSGFSKPGNGHITLGEHDLHQDYGLVKDYLGFVPQDDLLLSNLTVYENLYYYAKLRFPDRSKQDLDPQIDLVLRDIGLYEKKHTKVGSPVDKKLSGGQRKRLNIGLELLANAEVYLLDEPTSGLSSKDSENMVELLANIASSGKIVLVVIHQPSSKLYRMFNKLILLDNGGHLAFFGPTNEALTYFQQRRDTPVDGAAGEVECPRCKSVQPDLLLDTLEESLKDVDGRSLSDRKYSPQYWREQYDDFIKRKETVEAELPEIGELPPQQVIRFKDRINQLKTLIARNFLSKVRDRSNLAITFLGAPLLGWGVGWVTKFLPEGQTYNLYNNDLLELFLFTAVIVALFFGMTNSVDEIITDRAIIIRERMLSVQNRAYLGSKVLILILFAILQNILFIGAGFWVLELHELFVPHIAFLCVVSLVGISIGLVVSAFPNMSSKAAQNVIPLVLIPQIVLGGALIDFNSMNPFLRINKSSPIPEICQLMPSRWAYEGMVVLQAEFNRFDHEYDRLGDEWNDMKRTRPELYKKKSEIVSQHGEEYYQKLKDDLQEKVDQLEAKREKFMEEYGWRYGNAKIHEKVASADADFKRRPSSVYKIMVSKKSPPFVDGKTSTAYYDGVVLLIFSLIFLGLTLIMLRYREKVQRGIGAVRKLVRR